MVEILQQRHLWTVELTVCLDFITLVECFVRDSLGNVPVLTMEVVSGWNPKQRSLYLAEAFLQSRSKEAVKHIFLYMHHYNYLLIYIRRGSFSENST